jgi:hypothetical protein
LGHFEAVGLGHVEKTIHELKPDFDPHFFVGHEPNKIRVLLIETLRIFFNETLAQNLGSV